jgi:hypothetical protein
MISVHYICNGCGYYTSYKGKMETQLNVVSVDLTNYLLFTSGFKMEQPQMDLHFCDKCYSKIADGSQIAQTFGNDYLMRKNIEELKEQLSNVKRDFDIYRGRVGNLLKDANKP